jgi:NADH-quinone oxidoreductase subunit E
MISEKTIKEIEAAMKAFPESRSALLPAWHLINREQGFIAPEDIQSLAGIFHLHPAEVESTANFYDMFRLKKSGSIRIGVCTNVSCMLRGSEEIADRLKEALGIEFGETTSDGLFTLTEHECIGACDIAPAITINDEHAGPMTVAKIDEMVAYYRRGKRPEDLQG